MGTVKKELAGAKYIYGILRGQSEADFGPIGLGGAPVSTIVDQGLACVVSGYSDVPIASFPKEELVRRLIEHQSALEHVMSLGHTVLPAQFGTVLANAAEVRDLVSQGHERFELALDRLADQVEVEVAATWDMSRMLTQVSNTPEIAQTRHLLDASPNGPTLEQRVRLGKMVKEALDRERDVCGERIMALLGPCARDVQANPLISDQMVVNTAFLLPRSQQKELESRVACLDELFGDQLNFRIIGPLPPYTFSTVHVTKPNWEEIKEAKRALGLRSAVSAEKVRRAHRDLAAKFHPDLRPGDEVARLRFGQLRRSAEVLLTYCRDAGGACHPDGERSLTRGAVERALMIGIDRTRNDEMDSSRFGGLRGRG